ncbi:hypothetical protein Q4F19_08415 [Sphingomonas sp. BIUV-7]|uniref:Uncharacterized protein n=1 Tax=Sphingomonas natans TaxID=3063330 RepID=A0ABT8Y8U6_9SPHN|nr:hypothetical protein [Sphingomonas sp. BIUV-7]MDO6414402.1 hypothetical protein [Sphingomonas sp. BIUV-7]
MVHKNGFECVRAIGGVPLAPDIREAHGAKLLRRNRPCQGANGAFLRATAAEGAGAAKHRTSPIGVTCASASGCSGDVRCGDELEDEKQWALNEQV